MQITVLGSGNAFNQQKRFNSSYFIQSEEGNFLVDFGFTSMLALEREGIDIDTIDGVFITHYHGDHFGGIPALILSKKYISTVKKDFFIVGPGNVSERIHEVQRVLYPGTESTLTDLGIEFIAIKDNHQYELPVIFETFTMIHSEDSLPLGYLFHIENKKIGFTGDTGWHSGVERLVAKSDISFVECNFSEHVADGHISVDELDQNLIIQKRKASIYLTHLHEGSARKAKAAGYQLLEDGMTIHL